MQRAMDGEAGVGGVMRKIVDGLDDLRAISAGLTGEARTNAMRQWLVERSRSITPVRFNAKPS